MESLKNSTPLKEIFALEIGIFSLIFFTFYLVALSHRFEPCMADSICWAYFGGPLNVFSKIGLIKFDMIREHDT